MQVSIETVPRSGMLVISAIVGGYLVTRRFMGYSKREAARRFRAEFKGNERKQ